MLKINNILGSDVSLLRNCWITHLSTLVPEELIITTSQCNMSKTHKLQKKKITEKTHLHWILEKTLKLKKTEGKRRWGQQRMRWLDSIRLNGHEFEQALGDSKGQGSLACCSPRGHKELDSTWRLNSKCTMVCGSPQTKIPLIRGEGKNPKRPNTVFNTVSSLAGRNHGIYFLCVFL